MYQRYGYNGRIEVGPNSISADFKIMIRSNNAQGTCKWRHTLISFPLTGSYLLQVAQNHSHTRRFCVPLHTSGRIDRPSPIPTWLLARIQCGISASCCNRYLLQSPDKTLHYQVAVTHQLTAVGSKPSSFLRLPWLETCAVRTNVKTLMGWTRTGCSSQSRDLTKITLPACTVQCRK